MPPPRRASRRVRSQVPSVSQFSGRMGTKSTNVLFGMPKVASRSKFERAVEHELMAAGEGAESEELNLEDDLEPEPMFTYDPTSSSNPPRPRTKRAGWVRRRGEDTGTVFVQFRQGAVYAYYYVPYHVWRNFRRVVSPGKLINRTLNGYPYRRLSG